MRNRVKKHQVKNAVEAFNRWTNEQRDIIVGLGVSLEYADITPVQALNELDRMTGKAAEKSGRFQANNVSVWAYPTYLDRYVDYDPSSSSTSSADYGSSSDGFSGSGSSSSF